MSNLARILATFFFTAYLTSRLFISGIHANAGIDIFVNALLFTSFLFFLIGALKEGKLSAKFSITFIWLFAFATICIISILIAQYKLVAIENCVGFVALAVLFWIVVNCIDINSLLKVLLPTLAVVVIYGMYHKLFGNPIKAATTSNFSAENIYAGFLAMTMAFSISLRGRWMILLLVLCLAGIALSPSWASIASLVVALFLAPFMWRFNKKTSFLLAAICMFLVAVFFARVAPEPKRAIYQAAVEVNGTHLCWHHVLREFGFIPANAQIGPIRFFGVGLGNFQDYNAEYQTKVLYETANVHHDYLQIYSELGILGLGFFVLFWFSIIKTGFICEKELIKEESYFKNGPVIAGAFIGFFFSYFLNGTFGDLRSLPLLAIPFAAIWLVLYLKLKPALNDNGRDLLTWSLLVFCVFMSTNTAIYEHHFAAFAAIIGALILKCTKIPKFSLSRPSMIFLIVLFIPLTIFMSYFSIRLMRSYKVSDPEVALTLNQHDSFIYIKAAQVSQEWMTRATRQEAKEKHFGDVSSYLNNALRVRPRDSRVHFAYGNACLVYGNEGPANLKFLDCLRLAPKKPIFQYYYAKTISKDHKRALNEFIRALDFHNKSPAQLKLSPEIVNDIKKKIDELDD